MKNYDNWSHPINRKHTVEVTLQQWDYKWSFQPNPIDWNCVWLDILTLDFDEEYIFKNLVKNDINVSVSEDSDWELWVKYYLKKDNWDTLECEDQITDFKNNIVKLEIVECEFND